MLRPVSTDQGEASYQPLKQGYIATSITKPCIRIRELVGDSHFLLETWLSGGTLIESCVAKNAGVAHTRFTQSVLMLKVGELEFATLSEALYLHMCLAYATQICKARLRRRCSNISNARDSFWGCLGLL